MEYQDTNEATRKEACEQVKKIAQAIIRIRKKYYLCFSKISDADKKRYSELKAQMRSVASENGLEKLNIQLISDIDTQFGEEIPNDTDENGNPSNGAIEDLYQKFMKAVELQAELTVLAIKVFETDSKLAEAYFNKAKMCQDRAKEYEGLLVKKYSKHRLSCDRVSVLTEKFEEKAKNDMSNLFENSYNKYTSKDPLVSEEIKESLNICVKKNEEITSQLETERI